jgi:hypothetical protein
VNLTAEEMVKLGHPLDAVQYPPEMGGVSKGPRSHHTRPTRILLNHLLRAI